MTVFRLNFGSCRYYYKQNGKFSRLFFDKKISAKIFRLMDELAAKEGGRHPGEGGFVRGVVPEHHKPDVT
jgi:hypothetical protein